MVAVQNLRPNQRLRLKRHRLPDPQPAAQSQAEPEVRRGIPVVHRPRMVQRRLEEHTRGRRRAMLAAMDQQRVVREDTDPRLRAAQAGPARVVPEERVEAALEMDI